MTKRMETASSQGMIGQVGSAVYGGLRRLGRAASSALAGTDTEALALLKDQHRNVDNLFRLIEHHRDPGQKMKLFQELASALTTHALIEERHFYPAVRSPRTESLVKESLEEHRQLKRVIADLERLEGHGAFNNKLAELKEQVTHHAKEEEEGKLFLLVPQVLDMDQREAIGQEMIATMVELQQDERRHARLKPALA
jgi:hypothetical protein